MCENGWKIENGWKWFENDKKDTENYIENIDILEMLIPFVGPNYNFYKDLHDIDSNITKLSINKILIYFFIF